MMKRILVTFLISCVYLSAWSWTGSGTKEDPWVLTNTMTAILEDEGTLTISGTGDMPNGGYDYDVAAGDDIRRVAKALRKYTTWGKKSLLDAKWTEVPEGHESEYNFFKVSVEMR